MPFDPFDYPEPPTELQAIWDRAGGALDDSDLLCEHGMYSEDCDECPDLDESDTGY